MNDETGALHPKVTALMHVKSMVKKNAFRRVLPLEDDLTGVKARTVGSWHPFDDRLRVEDHPTNGIQSKGLTKMAQFDDRSLRVEATKRDYAVDEGLRAYMLQVYNYMAGGVALSGLVAYAIFALATTSDPVLAASGDGNVVGLRSGLYLTPFGYLLFATPLIWIVALAPLGLVILLSWRVGRMGVGAAQVAFWLFAAVMGASLSTIFLRFTATSISQVFFIAASAFGALSFVGYVTRKDLSGWGAFLIMGVVGIIVAALVNIFLQSSALQFAISVIGVLVFGALTAYDTQRIKDSYLAVQKDGSTIKKAAIIGALSLYLDFINLFVSLLQLFGNRQE